jgi:preprotein translocase subunit SecG
MLPVFVFFHFIVCVALVGLVLLHSGRDTGMSGMGFVPASQGGTHIVERNLTRLTIVVAAVFFANTVLLFRFLD